MSTWANVILWTIVGFCTWEGVRSIYELIFREKVIWVRYWWIERRKHIVAVQTNMLPMDLSVNLGLDYVAHQMTPAQKEWCRENLKGRYGIIPNHVYREIHSLETKIWFDKERDAMLFKTFWL